MTIPKEYLGAFKCGHRPSAREFIDEELSFKLLERIIQFNCEESRMALAWLTKFNNEFHKNVIKKGDTKAIHHTDELRRQCHRRENAKNVDIMSVRKSQLIYTSSFSNFCYEPDIEDDSDFQRSSKQSSYSEDKLIESIELREEMRNSLKN